MSFRAADVLDGVGGALLVATLGLGLVWIAGAVALQTPGARELRRDIQRSAILSKLNELLPPSGPILNALARADPFPRIRGPAADVPAPDAAHPARRRRAGSARERRASPRSRLWSRRAGVRLGGGAGIVVTNAHVVAGEDDTTVEADGGDGMDATGARLRPAQRRRRAAGAGARGAGAATSGRGADRRAGRDPRVSGERPLQGGRRPSGRDAHGSEPRCLRERPGTAGA